MTLLLYHIILFLSIEKHKKTLILSIFFFVFSSLRFFQKSHQKPKQRRPNSRRTRTPERLRTRMPGILPAIPAHVHAHACARARTYAPTPTRPRAFIFFFILPPLLPSASVWAPFFLPASFSSFFLPAPFSFRLWLLFLRLCFFS